jgi:hypothetical protein
VCGALMRLSPAAKDINAAHWVRDGDK